MLKIPTLLRIQMSLFSPTRSIILNTRLPSRHTSHEHFLDIFKRFARRLGEEEESVNSHSSTKDAEDEVNAPLDVDESGWDEV
jgi:hypothetical protein